MFIVTGKLSGKSVIKSGQYENGTWRVIQFLIKKTRNKKPELIPFTAKGKLAEKIDSIAIGEKITISFFIEGSKYGEKYYTNCIATEVEKYIRKDKYKYGSVSFGNEQYEDKNDELRIDNNLYNQKI
jgi:hypothetical protein